MADIWFKVHRQALNEAIATVFPAVDVRSKIPLLGSILLECDGKALHLRGTNLEIQIETTCELLSVHGKCSFALPADRLKAFVAATGESAEITFGPGRLQGQVKIMTGISTASLSFVPFEAFPTLSADGVDLVEINGATLARALKAVSFAVSKKEDRPYLTGICLHQAEIDGEDCLTVVATDGVAMARIRCLGMCIPDLPQPYALAHVIVPPAFAKEAARLFEKEKDEWKIGATDALIVAKTPGARLISKLIDGHYPDYERVIPTHKDYLEIAAADLQQSITRMSIIAESADKEAMVLRIKDHRATLLAYNPATGGAREDLDAETEIENFEVGFNGAQMLNVLREVDVRYVRIYLGEGQMRALKVCPTGATDTFVVVPMIPKAMPEEV